MTEYWIAFTVLMGLMSITPVSLIVISLIIDRINKQGAMHRKED